MAFLYQILKNSNLNSTIELHFLRTGQLLWLDLRTLTRDPIYRIVSLLFFQLMSQDEERCRQTRSNENTEPSRQTIDIFNLKRQILCNTPPQKKRIRKKLWTHYIIVIVVEGEKNACKIVTCPGIPPVSWCACLMSCKPKFLLFNSMLRPIILHRTLFNKKKKYFYVKLARSILKMSNGYEFILTSV